MKTESKKIFIVAIVFNILMIIILALGVFMIIKKNQSLIDLKKQIVEENAKLTDLKSLKIMVEDTKDERDYLANLFVDRNNIIDFIESLEHLGDLSGAKVKVILVDDGGDKPDVNKVNIRFEARGDWASVFKLISLVDHMPTALSLNAMEMSFEEEEVGKKILSLWSVVFEINIYKNI